MSERKVLQKWFPPDFDPSAIVRVRGPKQTGPKVQTVRLMAPFGMKCTTCGEFIYKGRKFNARKETTDQKYYSIPIYRFYIRCTRCSGEITFKTDPKNMDYECEKGAKRNFEPWRAMDSEGARQETDEERLDRLEREEAERGEQDAMGQLEGKMVDAKREMAIADALDEIRTKNARNERVVQDAAGAAARRWEEVDRERERQENEDAEAARKAFMTEDGDKVRRLVGEDGVFGIELEGEDDARSESTVYSESTEGSMGPPPLPLSMPPATSSTFKRVPKRKKDFSAALGIKKRPALV